MGVAISCMSNIMYLSEKVILYSTCVGLVSSVIIMFVVTLGMGIGLGYNYCFVDMKTKYKYVPGHYVYPHNLRYPYYRRAGEQTRQGPGQQDQALQLQQYQDGMDRASQEQREIDELRYSPTFTPSHDRSVMMQKLGLINRDYSIFNNGSTTEAYDFDNEEDVTTTTTTTNSTVVEVEIETQFENTTAATEGTESTETITTSETIETEETTDTFEATDTTEVTDTKTEDMYNAEDPTPEPLFPDEKRRVKKLVIPISGLDLVSLLSKLSAEKNNHSLQIVTT